jgi:hypothetical protein
LVYPGSRFPFGVCSCLFWQHIGGDQEMPSNLCAGRQVLRLSFPLTNARKAVTRILTNGGNNGKFCVLVNQVHFSDLVGCSFLIFLINTVPINPNITITKSLRHSYSVFDCVWQIF